MLNKINFLTAGESHGKGLLGIIEGIPAGLNIQEKYINFHLSRRQKGFGRGKRMKIETDRAERASKKIKAASSSPLKIDPKVKAMHSKKYDFGLSDIAL